MSACLIAVSPAERSLKAARRTGDVQVEMLSTSVFKAGDLMLFAFLSEGTCSRGCGSGVQTATPAHHAWMRVCAGAAAASTLRRIRVWSVGVPFADGAVPPVDEEFRALVLGNALGLFDRFPLRVVGR